MKNLFRLLRCALPVLMAPAVLLAQKEPIITVDINEIDVFSGQGGVLQLVVVSGGSGYSTVPTVTFTGGGGSGAAATATLSSGVVTGLTLTNPGTGYTSPPIVTLSAPGTTALATATLTAPGAGVASPLTVTDPGSGYTAVPSVSFTGGGGTGAAATATVTNGTVTSITVTNAGTGYTTAPTVVIAPPGATATAAANGVGTVFLAPFQNESYGPVRTPINIVARAIGTFPVAGYTYSFFINGESLGLSTNSQPPGGGPGIIGWQPPQPGSYLLTVTATDGTHTATSLAVRYFATGTAFIGPVDNSLVPAGSSVVMQATATPAPAAPAAFVQRMEFYVDGNLVGTDTTYPYSYIYTPSSTVPTHTIEARAFDNLGNQISPTGTAVRRINMVTPIGTPPTVRILNPTSGANVTTGAEVTLITEAVSPSGFIRNVDFYLNGVQLSSSTTFPFTAKWTPTVPGTYQFTAIGFDDKSNAVASTPITITVTGGFPTSAITTPAPGAANNAVQGSIVPVTVRAAGADGGITSIKTIELLVDGLVNDKLPKVVGDAPAILVEPFIFNWRASVTVGTHRLSARVTDVSGLTITSAEVLVNVIPNQLPQVSISGPVASASLTPNAPTTITAIASDTDGSVASVEFFANGVSLGSDDSSPFQFIWTPTAGGTVDLTARVTDNGGATSTSATVTVVVEPPLSPGSIATTVFRGSYGGTGETGQFTFGINRNNRGTFIAYSTAPTGRIYFWTDIPLATDGTFVVRNAAEQPLLMGQTSATGVSGTFGDKTFIGPVTLGSNAFNPTVLGGTLTGDPASTVVGIVGGDGSVTLYVASGDNRQAGSTLLTGAGSFNFTTSGGTRLSGSASSSAGVIGGSATGTLSGNFLLSLQPGRITNISTRALAGTAERTMVAGFVVRGTGTKPLLVRAAGPTLANFGVANALIDPSITIFSGTTTVGSNNDWGSTAALIALSNQVGAFPFNAGSRDSALQISVAPGTYTAVIGGAGATPGTALIELYDTNAANASTARITNISTRGGVAPGEPLIAGFVISGDQRKRLLIRAVGPTLSTLGINGALADPRIEVFSGTSSIALNNDWTDVTVTSQVASVGAAVGAFALNAGSRDAGIVLQLNPGSYTVQVTGAPGTSGTALVEVYDADP